MKEILGHRARSRGEIVEILARGGTYTCPTLPHDRYGRVKQACRDLRRLGLVRVTGRTPVAVNLALTPLFREWRRAHAAGPRRGGPGRLWSIPTHKPDLKPARLARKLTMFPSDVALLAAATGCRLSLRLDLPGRDGLALARAYDRAQAAWGDPRQAFVAGCVRRQAAIRSPRSAEA